YTTASPQTSGQSSLQAPTIIPILPGSSRTMHLPAISNLIPQKHLSGKIVKTKPAIPAAKRPLSDFNFFCRDARKLVVEAHPEYTKEQVNKELGRIWSMLDSSSRQHYRRMYVQDKQRYSSDVAAMDASMSGAILKSGIHHTVPVAPVAASTQSSYRNSNPNFGDIDIAHNTSPGRCSTSNRVKSIIWKHAKETISEEDPSKLSSLTSVPIPIVASETNTGGHSQSSVTDLLHIDETSCNYSINQATHSRGNTIESILNEVCNLERLGNTGESDDHDEPLAHSLVSNGGRCSIYAVQEHRLRETISAPAGSIKSKN
ncbi:high mobility group, partial [Coemansia sp. RSA 2607]